MRDPDRRRVNSHRYPVYDYAQPGMVFITVCTAGRQHLFGQVEQHGVVLSPAGDAVTQWWQGIPERCPGVAVDAFIVMPDHLHGILAMGSDPDVTAAPTTGDVVRWLKNALLRDYADGVRRAGWEPYDRALWQRDYYDRIIRTDSELAARRAYIVTNPSRWWEAEIERDDEDVGRRAQGCSRG